MVVVVWGFPSQHIALQWEWCWQHPFESKKLREVAVGLKQIGPPHKLKAKIRYMYEMLHQPPWDKLSLKVHWLTDAYHSMLNDCPSPPPHIKITIGKMEDIEAFFGKEQDDLSDNEGMSDSDANDLLDADCKLCTKELIPEFEKVVQCWNGQCRTSYHMLCLSAHFLRADAAALIPSTGTCLACASKLTWSELIQAMKQREQKRAASLARQKENIDMINT